MTRSGPGRNPGAPDLRDEISPQDTSNLRPGRLAAALDYASRGWRVLPVGQNKVPLIGGWQNAGSVDPDQIREWWRAHPTAGVGILTGRASGFFVLDVDQHDPHRDGIDTLRRLEAQHGELPVTYTVRTGSGGLHLYFAMPDDFDITNNQSGRIGPGLDVRGTGGQVVAPPSVHGTGNPYRWVRGEDPEPAPPWLLELLRPVAREVSVPGPAVDPEDDARPGTRYNRSTTWAELLGRYGWTLHHVDHSGEEHWTRPGKERREGTSATVGFGGSDVLKVFTSSVPELVAEATYDRFGFFAAMAHGGDLSAAARALRADYDRADLDAWCASAEEPLSAPAEPDARPSLSDEFRAALLRGHAIGTLPPPEYLIDGVLPARALSSIYGPSGHGKSFVVLDMARAIIDGRTWHGHATTQGSVFYVVAEGASGQAQRLDAATEHYGTENADSVIWLPRTVNLSSRFEVTALIEVLREERPALVVIDTQARCTVGVEENSSKEMGVVIDECERIIREASTAVLLVHHSGMDVSRGLRGSTAQLGAMEAVLSVHRTGESEIRFSVEKMKNGPEDIEHRFRLEPVARSVAVIEVAQAAGALPETLAEALRALDDLDEGSGVASGKWLKALADRPERTFHSWRKRLLSAELVRQTGATNHHRYSLTDKGRLALARSGLQPTATDCNGRPDGLPATATTPEGLQCADSPRREEEA